MKLFQENKKETNSGICCWNFCLVFQKKPRGNQGKEKTNRENLESVNRLAVLHGFKAAVITEKQAEK